MISKIEQTRIKGGLISKRFFLWLQSPKKVQSEKLSEIKPPLEY